MMSPRSLHSIRMANTALAPSERARVIMRWRGSRRAPVDAGMLAPHRFRGEPPDRVLRPAPGGCGLGDTMSGRGMDRREFLIRGTAVGGAVVSAGGAATGLSSC